MHKYAVLDPLLLYGLLVIVCLFSKALCCSLMVEQMLHNANFGFACKPPLPLSRTMRTA